MGVDAAHSIDAPASDDNIKKNLPASKLCTCHFNKFIADIALILPPNRFYMKSTARALQPDVSCIVRTQLDILMLPPLPFVEETQVYAMASQFDPFCIKGTQNAVASKPDVSYIVET